MFANPTLSITHKDGFYRVAFLSSPKNQNTSWQLHWNDFEQTLDGQGIALIPDSLTKDGGRLVCLKISNHNTTHKRLYFVSTQKIQHIPLWTSIIPPLLAIGMALWLKEVLISLFMGIWAGVWLTLGFQIDQIFAAFLRIFDTYIIEVMMDRGHISVIVFSMVIGGMVAIISRNGGMQGVVHHLKRYANNAQNAQWVTWLLGILIFFDDYANSLIVGNTMRPVMDKFKVSRAKLAYLVDSTAAPIASVAFITTWIGAELGYIQDAIQATGLKASPYQMFIGSLKYAFYPLFTLFFMFWMIRQGKEYGSMLEIERSARNGKDPSLVSSETSATHPPSSSENLPSAPAWLALIPVFTLLIATFIGLFVTGYDPAVWGNPQISIFSKLSSTIGAADSYKALLWASGISLGLALSISIFSGRLKLQESMETTVDGFKSIFQAMIILIAAWSLALLTHQLHTADFLSEFLGAGFPVRFMPMLTFLLAAVIAFSTGSSWSTMAILFPIALPTAYALVDHPEAAASMEIFYHVIASVMAGSVLGDHCSPISDTTILSSLSSGCDHLIHVKTQMPYALTVGIISLLCGSVLFAFHFPWWLSYILGFPAVMLVIRWLGKPVVV